MQDMHGGPEHMQTMIRGYIAAVERELDQRLPPDDTPPHPLHAAMRYSVFAGGKRLRPLLCLAAAAAVDGRPDQALLPAAALELLHTYTLVHDDLPAMDNDTLRRGRPTLHVAFGEANAILAGDALLTMAFEWLADCRAPAARVKRLVAELARAAGSLGVIAGQTADIAAENQPVSAAMVDYIHRHKTGRLICAAVRMGAITAGADRSVLAALSVFGENIGLAFQIQDDILNITASAAQLGKAAGSDAARGKMTWPAAHGLPAARRAVRAHTAAGIKALAQVPGDAGLLKYLARKMTRRKQ